MKSHEYPDIEFTSDGGKKIKLVFDKVEFRAYVYEHGGWKPMMLGSTRVEPLISYIEKNY